MGGKRVLKMCTLALVLLGLASLKEAMSHGVHPLSKIAAHKTTYAFDDRAYVNVTPTVLGAKLETTVWVTVDFSSPTPSNDDWIAVFSPANFSTATCPKDNPYVLPPLLCTAPLKYKYANYTSPNY